MDFSCVTNLSQRKNADVLVVPFYKQKNAAKAPKDSSSLKAHYEALLGSGDFEGKEGQTALIYSVKEKEKRILALGLGERSKLSVESLRRAYGGALKAILRLEKVNVLNLVFPNDAILDAKDVLKGISEGLCLVNYRFVELKNDSLKEDAKELVKKACFVGLDKKLLKHAKEAAKLCESVYFCRDLANRNADTVTPKYLAGVAKKLAQTYPKVKTTVFDKKRIEKEGMGLFLAVNRGSVHDPAFMIVKYQGNPSSKDHTVLVGKGVTYDTGGLNLKPTGYMETMKYDMCGAATVLASLDAVARLGLKLNVTAVVAATENSIGSMSYKPGDVYKGYSGKTVEIGNTDAEGRLTLADALAYSVDKLAPTRILDFATLTGAVVVALGNETIGLMSNDDALCKSFEKAASSSFERVCRLPLYDEYREQLKSDIADLNNIGGRAAGSITAGMFLKEFVGKVPWVHFDIAGVADLPKERRYHPKHGSGIGVRLVIEYFKQLL